MSFSSSPRQFRPPRPRRPPPTNMNHPDSMKRFKADDQGQSGFYPQQSNMNATETRFNSASSPQFSTATSDQENNVLLFTIMNAAYPITVDVMKAICSPYGQILRIVIFRKNGVQALVEFDALTSARNAKEKLQGADIYSGCCTLKIDYAKSKRLNVARNDTDNYDCEFNEQDASHQQQALLSTTPDAPPPGLLDHNYPRMMRSMPDNRPPQFNQHSAPYNTGYYNESATGGFDAQQSHQPPRQFRPTHHNDPYQMNPGYNSPRGPRYGPPNAPGGYYGGPAPMMGSAGVHSGMGPHGSGMGYNDQCVMLVNNLTPDKMNCDLLFNFLCVYGNVLRIKFLKSREGCAMVQMSQADPLNLFLRQINNTFLFGNRIGITQSKQEYLEPVAKPFTLTDGQPSYKDFHESRANRYIDPKSASRNRPTAPSTTLYYFNTPPDFSEEDVCKIFDTVGAKRPLKIKNFAVKKNPEDSRLKGVTGLALWASISEASEALILCNNHLIEHQSSKWPYIFKVTFSAANMPAGAVTPEGVDQSQLNEAGGVDDGQPELIEGTNNKNNNDEDVQSGAYNEIHDSATAGSDQPSINATE